MGLDKYQLLGVIADRKQPVRGVSFSPPDSAGRKTLISVDLEGAAILYQNFLFKHKIQTGVALYCCAWLNACRFVLGDKSGCVSIFDWVNETATLIKKVQVAKQNVSSIAVGGGLIACGSWDGHVYCYDTDLNALIWETNRNLRYAVTVNIAQGLVFAGSQAKILSAFDGASGRLLNQVESAHEDIIRQIRIVRDENGQALIVTSSNDAMVKFWDLQLQELCVCPANESGCFCFDVCAINTNLAITANDDGSICAVDFVSNQVDKLTQVACTLWSLDYDGDELLVAGSDSGELLIFGDTVSNSLPGQVKLTADALAAREAEIVAILTQKAKQADAENAQDFSKLPKAADRHLHPGRKVGQTSLFQEDGQIKVYQWSGKEWVYIGDMMGKPDQGASTIGEAAKIYEGDEFFPAGKYDYIFNVEIDQRPGDNPRLPYNNGQNTLDVAERFCALHNLPKANIQDIVKFVQQNATGATTIPPTPTRQPTTSDTCVAQMILYSTPAKWPAVFSKIRELDQANGGAISRLAVLDTLEASVSRPNFLNCDDVRLSEVHFLFTWPNDHYSHWPDPYPIIDLCRYYILNAHVIQKLRQHNMIRGIIQLATMTIKTKQANSTLMALRLLANMMSVQSLRETLLNTMEVILQTMCNEGTLANNQIAVALMSLCHNCALARRLQSRGNSASKTDNLATVIQNTIKQVCATSNANLATLQQETEKLL